MKKKVLSLILGLCIICTQSFLTSVPVFAAQAEIFVSPTGSDSNSGSQQSPLATFEGAKNKVLELKKANTSQPITVYFMEGDYKIYTEQKLSGIDSGTKDAPVTYKAYNGAEVRFSGSYEVDFSGFSIVSDEEKDVLFRIPEEARGKVGYVDLSEQEIYGLSLADSISSTNHIVTHSTGSRMYIDDVEAVQARWPNGRDFATFSDSQQVGNDSMVTVDGETKSRLARYKYVDSAYIFGYFSHDYLCEIRKVLNFNDGNITLDRIDNGFYATKGKYFLTNLLEELDMPGEYFLDINDKKLYYYPINKIDDSTIELSATTDLISINNASYINFEGITFDKLTGTAVKLDACSNIAFRGCRFTNIGYNAITANNVNSFSLQSCDFKSIGNDAIILKNGNFTTLESSNNGIVNCTFYDTGKYILAGNNCIELLDVGARIEHNLFGRINGQSILHRGNDNIIRYNEIYDEGAYAGDAGAIYTGQTFHQTGSEISYNYLNNVLHAGIYVDDIQSGINVNHNIINSTAGQGLLIGGGRYNILDSNIIINTVSAPIHYDNRGLGWAVGSPPNMVNQMKMVPYDQSPYREKYPWLRDVENDEPGVPKYATITNNLLYNCNTLNNIASEVEKYAENISNNNSVDDDVEFVDAANYNFELKKGSEMAGKMPTLTDMQVDKVGLYNDEYRKEFKKYEISDFKLLAPVDGAQGINNLPVSFSWTEADGASSYSVQIAKDKEFTNIVKETVSDKRGYMPSVTVTGLQADGNQLYWRVKAVNKSKQLGNVKYSEVFVMQTTDSDVLDKTELQNQINGLEKFVSSIKEGSASGEFAVGTKDFLNNVLSKAKEALEKEKGHQADLNVQTENIKSALNAVAAAMNTKYTNIDNMVKSADDWKSTEGKVTLEDGIIKNILGGATFKDKTPTDQILCFKLKMSGFAGGWMVMGINQNLEGQSAIGTNGYLICYTAPQIEYQKYEPAVTLIPFPNNQLVITDQWHDVQLGALKAGDGVRIFMNIDGTQVFDFIDTVNPLPLDGYFSLGARGDQMNYMSIGVADKVPSNTVGSLEAAKKKYEQLTAKTQQEVTEGPSNKGGTQTVEENTVDIEFINVSELLSNKELWSGLEAKDDIGIVVNEQALLNEPVALNSDLSFSAMLETDGGYSTISFRQAENKESGYQLIVKNDVILLKRQAGGKQAYLSIMDNKFVKPGLWCKFNIITADVIGGTQITVKVNGCDILRVIDNKPIKEKGLLGFSCSENSKMTIR